MEKKFVPIIILMALCAVGCATAGSGVKTNKPMMGLEEAKKNIAGYEPTIHECVLPRKSRCDMYSSRGWLMPGVQVVDTHGNVLAHVCCDHFWDDIRAISVQSGHGCCSQSPCSVPPGGWYPQGHTINRDCYPDRIPGKFPSIIFKKFLVK